MSLCLDRVTNPAKGRYPDACFDGFLVRRASDSLLQADLHRRSQRPFSRSAHTCYRLIQSMSLLGVGQVPSRRFCCGYSLAGESDILCFFRHFLDDNDELRGVISLESVALRGLVGCTPDGKAWGARSIITRTCLSMTFTGREKMPNVGE